MITENSQCLTPLSTNTFNCAYSHAQNVIYICGAYARGNIYNAEMSDEHPMNYLRVNCTLQQFDEFLDFYGIEEGDKMYLAPEDRVNIW